MITITGLLLIPLSLIFLLLPWSWAIIFLVPLVVLSDAAVLLVGSTGLYPYHFFSLLLVGRFIFEVLVLKRPLSRMVGTYALPLFLFALAAIVTYFAAVTLFQGEVFVMPGSAKFRLSQMQPFAPVRQNINQFFYLFVNTATILVLATVIAVSDFERISRVIDKAILTAIGFAVAICAWQMANFYAGLPFPDSFFHSDATTEASGQRLPSGILRTNGPFPEPSAAGRFFAAAILYCWQRFRFRLDPLSIIMTFACLAILGLTTSTTAYFGIALFFAVMIRDFVFGMSGVVPMRLRLNVGFLVSMVISAAAVFAIFVFIAANLEVISEIITGTVLEKSQSNSFEQRSGADLLALDILRTTWGLGVGLGSHRPNSYLMALLSNTGVIGTLLFAVFVFLLVRPQIRRHASGASARLARERIVPLQWMLLGTFVTLSFSGPDPHQPQPWLLCGLLLGLIVSWRRSLKETAPPPERAYARAAGLGGVPAASSVGR